MLWRRLHSQRVWDAIVFWLCTAETVLSNDTEIRSNRLQQEHAYFSKHGQWPHYGDAVSGYQLASAWPAVVRAGIVRGEVE
jgi:hypothetical protein